MSNNYVDNLSLVPRISKSQFDHAAECFLMDTCKEALERPMPVPIVEIARKKLGLRVLTDYHLSEDLSILGMCCFTTGVVDVYDKEEDEFREMVVRRGTILIDPDTYFLRNLGCFDNTLSHECVHWHDHRFYHFAQAGVNQGTAIACRCPVESKDESTQQTWTDEDWMEWQANGIAPRILMPKKTFPQQIENIKRDIVSVEGLHHLADKAIIKRAADFFRVSLQSATIRVEELGITL